jgi:hypothetical protein
LIESIIGGRDFAVSKGGDLNTSPDQAATQQDQDGNEFKRPSSAFSFWWLFYDCIAKFPKFEQLKNFINESHRLKEFQNDKQRKKKIDEYFAKLKKQ